MGIEIVNSWFCASWRWGYTVASASNPRKKYTVSMGGPETSPRCSCPAFQYCKIEPQTCKHIATLINSEGFCGWVAQWCDEVYEDDHKCPRCNEEVEACRIAV